MASNRYEDPYAFEAQVESQFMDISSLDRSVTRDSVIIDSQTGLRFKRRSGYDFQQSSFNQTAPRTRSASILPITPPPATPQSILHLKSSMDEPDGFHSHQLGNQTPYSTCITETSIESSVELKDTVPDAPPSEYHKCIPRHFTVIQHMRQLLIWHTLNEIKNQQETPAAFLDENAQKAQKYVIQVQQKLVQGLLDGQIDISWFARPEDSQPMFERREHPVNIRNEKKLEALEQAIQLFKDENEDWRNCTERIYDLHAAATNQVEAEQDQPMNMDVDQVDTDSILDHLDERQRDFLQKYGTLDTRQELTSNIDLGVTQLRQTLNTVHQFATRTEKYSDRMLAGLARRTKESGRLVPIEHDRRIPGVFDNTEQKRKQSEFESVRDILILLSKKKPKRSS